MTSNNSNNLTLRILCLHDRNSNAIDMKQKQLHILGKKLYEKHSIDLVYINSPLVVAVDNDDDDNNNNNNEKQEQQQKRIWWEEKERNINNDNSKTKLRTKENNNNYNNDNDDDNNNNINHRNTDTTDSDNSHTKINTATGDDNEEEEDDNDNNNNCQEIIIMNNDEKDIQYCGLDASIMLVQQIWNNTTPFWGIIAIGQGAAIATILITLLFSNTYGKGNNEETNEFFGGGNEITSAACTVPPSFAIFISGETIVPVNEPLLDNDTTIPTLHLIDSQSSSSKYKQQQQQERLLQQFPGTVIERSDDVSNDNHNDNSLSNHDINSIGRYIIEQKKQLYGISTTTTTTTQSNDNIKHKQDIVTLQTALHIAENEAANCIATTIAANPPSALMAVIRPQNVVTGGWDKYNTPLRGAPCPSEFLLQRNKRNNNNNNNNDNNNNTDNNGPSRIHPQQQQQQQQD